MFENSQFLTLGVLVDAPFDVVKEDLNQNGYNVLNEKTENLPENFPEGHKMVTIHYFVKPFES